MFSNFSGETVGATGRKPEDFLVDLGKMNKIVPEKLRRISTRFRAKSEKRETTSRYRFFFRGSHWNLDNKNRSDRFSNFSGETVGDTGKELKDFPVDLSEMNNFQ